MNESLFDYDIQGYPESLLQALQPLSVLQHNGARGLIYYVCIPCQRLGISKAAWFTTGATVHPGQDAGNLLCFLES